MSDKKIVHNPSGHWFLEQTHEIWRNGTHTGKKWFQKAMTQEEADQSLADIDKNVQEQIQKAHYALTQGRSATIDLPWATIHLDDVLDGHDDENRKKTEELLASVEALHIKHLMGISFGYQVQLDRRAYSAKAKLNSQEERER